MQRLVFASVLGILALVPAHAQENTRFTFDFSGGYTVPVGATGHYANFGWNAGGGVGINLTQRWSANLNLRYDSLGLNNTTVSAIGVPGGQVNVFHATLDPVFHLTPAKRIDTYLTGGGGEFHTLRQFSQAMAGPTSAYIPLLGFSAPVNGPVPIPAGYVVNKPGFDVGAGMSAGAIGHGKVFFEARWNHVFLSGGHLDFIPVSFGYRW